MRIETVKLINRSKEGDKEAFGQLVLDYSNYVYSVVFRLVNNEPRAEDLVQETFIKAWRNINLYSVKRSKFTTWLFTIATRLSIDWMKTHNEWLSLAACRTLRNHQFQHYLRLAILGWPVFDYWRIIFGLG